MLESLIERGGDFVLREVAIYVLSEEHWMRHPSGTASSDR